MVNNFMLQGGCSCLMLQETGRLHSNWLLEAESEAFSLVGPFAENAPAILFTNAVVRSCSLQQGGRFWCLAMVTLRDCLALVVSLH